MQTEARYQGYPDRAHWNVILWVGDNPYLYNRLVDMVYEYKKESLSRDQLITAMYEEIIRGLGGFYTPDGMRVTKKIVQYMADSFLYDIREGLV